MSSSTNKKAKIEENEHDPFSDWHELWISSKDRDATSQGTSDFSVTLKDWKNWVDAINLEQVTLPALYNIDASNNVITFNEGGGDLTATITPGAYSTSVGTVLLQAAIKTALDAAGGQVYTVTYDDNAYKLTISAAGNFQISWGENSILANMLGFSAADTALSTSVVSDLVLDLAIDDLFLNIEELSMSGRNNATNNLHYTFRLPLNDDTFGVKNTLYRSYQLANQSRYYDNPRMLNKLRIRVLTKFGEVKDFQGANFSFVLKYRNFSQRN